MEQADKYSKAKITFKTTKRGSLPEVVEFDDVFNWPELQQLHPADDFGIQGYSLSRDIPVGSVEIAHYNKERDTLEISYKAKNNYYTKTFDGEDFEIEYTEK